MNKRINRKPKVSESTNKEELQKRIEEKAYDFLYLKRGGQNGNDLVDWLEAEKDILAQNK